jgi:hypothetical protein
MSRSLSKKKLYIPLLLTFVFISSIACVHLSEEQKREYGILESAVTFSSDKVIGEYGDSIPSDFDSEKFMSLVEGRIPNDYYRALEKHHKELKVKGSYYLLLIREVSDNAVILFDYSCTPEVDGPVLLDPEKYDASRVESYDKCAK